MEVTRILVCHCMRLSRMFTCHCGLLPGSMRLPAPQTVSGLLAADPSYWPLSL